LTQLTADACLVVLRGSRVQSQARPWVSWDKAPVQNMAQSLKELNPKWWMGDEKDYLVFGM